MCGQQYHDEGVGSLGRDYIQLLMLPSLKINLLQTFGGQAFISAILGFLHQNNCPLTHTTKILLRMALDSKKYIPIIMRLLYSLFLNFRESYNADCNWTFLTLFISLIIFEYNQFKSLQLRGPVVCDLLDCSSSRFDFSVCNYICILTPLEEQCHQHEDNL